MKFNINFSKEFFETWVGLIISIILVIPLTVYMAADYLILCFQAKGVVGLPLYYHYLTNKSIFLYSL
jgi:hypothetical protein